MLGRRSQKKLSWRDSLDADAGDADTSAFAPPPASLPEVREEAPEPTAHAARAPSYRMAASDTVTDLDVTKIDVQENTGHGTVMDTTSASATTMFPSDVMAGTAFGPVERVTKLRSLDFSLDDIDTPSTTRRPASPVFSPGKPSTAEKAEAERAALFEEIERAHREAHKASKKN